MALIEEFTRRGNWLFKYRSYLPAVVFALFIIAFYFDRNEMVDFREAWWMALCGGISILGLLVRAYTIGTVPKGTSGKNSKEQRAESLNTSGIYSMLRHPLYLGNFLIWLGPLVYTGNPWLILLICLAFWIYYERIMFAEETFLRQKYGRQYLDWSEQTPPFLPAFSKFRKPDLSFSFRNVLKRESHAFVNTVLSFVFIDFAKNYFLRNEYQISHFWQYLLAASVVMFLILRLIIKKTRWLHVEGR